MLKIGNKTFKSRLMVGTGKFSSLELMGKTLIESKSEIITVSLRRIDLSQGDRRNILDFIPSGVQLLPNTSGARNADEAIKLAKLARAATGTNWIKIEVVPDPHYLLPDPIDTLRATEALVKDGFTVLPYINADPVLAKRLEDVGAATVMPLGSPIGTNRGIKTLEMLKIIIEQARVPVVVDAGLGRPSDAAMAMELGADAVLVNTAMAVSNNPLEMAKGFELAVRAGRIAYVAGLPKTNTQATPSSPIDSHLTGFLSNN
ncbi:thiazole synthase [Halobacteriovorax marinus]|uniref:Thiazole synthase n=1 Tax=Halobacteriovorax marinus TaxID=97084 RepID=A0A1Y5F989_9BACT|nr:thiazole synthase [Halobacteriovorax marinus]